MNLTDLSTDHPSVRAPRPHSTASSAPSIHARPPVLLRFGAWSLSKIPIRSGEFEPFQLAPSRSSPNDLHARVCKLWPLAKKNLHQSEGHISNPPTAVSLRGGFSPFHKCNSLLCSPCQSLQTLATGQN